MENSKNLIIETALKLFATEGFDKTPISKIAKEAGISQGLMYNYFHGKDELLEEIMQAGLQQIVVAIQYNKAEKNPAEAVKKFISQYFELLEENKEFWRLFNSLRLQKNIIEKTNETSAIISGTLAENFKKLGAKKPEMEANILIALIDGVIIRFFLNEENKEFNFNELKENIIAKYTFN